MVPEVLGEGCWRPQEEAGGGGHPGALLGLCLARGLLSQPEVRGQPQTPERSTGGGEGMKENNFQKNMPCFFFFFLFKYYLKRGERYWSGEDF